VTDRYTDLRDLLDLTQTNVFNRDDVRALLADYDRMREAMVRIERAVDLNLGRSSWTQTRHLKGVGYSEAVRKELYAAHDQARAALAQEQGEKHDNQD